MRIGESSCRRLRPRRINGGSTSLGQGERGLWAVLMTPEGGETSEKFLDKIIPDAPSLLSYRTRNRTFKPDVS